MIPLPREVRRKPAFVYVDAALDGGVYRLGLFSMELGSRSAVPPEQPPNQQCAEARAVLWGLKFILNVGIREAHVFGDNAAALVQLLQCKQVWGVCTSSACLSVSGTCGCPAQVLRFTFTGCMVQ